MRAVGFGAQEVRARIRSLFPPPPHHSVLELQDKLDVLWGIIKEPMQLKLVKGTCRQWNALARGFESSNFTDSHFPFCDKSCSEIKALMVQLYPDRTPTFNCTSRRELGTTATKDRQLLTASAFAPGAQAIYDNYMLNVDAVMVLLAEFHDLDETLLRAWKDSGIEKGLNTLYEAIDAVRGGWMVGWVDRLINNSSAPSSIFPSFPFHPHTSTTTSGKPSLTSSRPRWANFSSLQNPSSTNWANSCATRATPLATRQPPPTHPRTAAWWGRYVLFDEPLAGWTPVGCGLCGS